MTEPKTFPTLYKRNESGEMQRWDIQVERLGGHALIVDEGIIVTCWGRVGGAQQETREVISEGKNPGKTNETSPFEQACKEALSKWQKQQKARKYTPNFQDAVDGLRNEEFVTGGIDPMLAFPREKKPKALIFPCDDQPKLDGHRCMSEVTAEDGTVTVALWSRTRKPITSMPHIIEAIRAHFQRLVDGCRMGVKFKVWLDGELYFHDLARVPTEFLAKYENPKEAKFQYISSLIRPQEPVEGYEKVEYHTYDMVDLVSRWVLREEWRKVFLSDVALPLVLVPTRRAGSEEELSAHEEEYVAAGYEGLMARNLDGLYVGKRTSDLLKVKRFIDAEFEVIEVSCTKRQVTDSKGERTMVYANFKCKLPGWTGPGDKAHEFDTTINGKQELQADLLIDAGRHVGKKLTVKFFGYTADNIPRFPKGLRFREDL